MCSDRKCISLETGSLIYAIISVILTGLGMLFIIGALVYVNVMIGVTVHEDAGPEQMRTEFAVAFMSNIVLIVLLCILLVPFAFTVVLIKGLVEKKAGLVKVYFIYSVVSKSLALIAAVMGILSGRYPIEHAITVLVATACYGLILRLIYLTYKKMEVDALYKQTRLIEEKF